MQHKALNNVYKPKVLYISFIKGSSCKVSQRCNTRQPNYLRELMREFPYRGVAMFIIILFIHYKIDGQKSKHE